MWSNKQSNNPPGTQSGSGVATLTEPAPPQVTAPTKTLSEIPRPNGSAARAPSWLGPGLKIKGQLSGAEDLQLECKMDGPVSLGDHRLTVGQNGHISGEITASEVVVFGEVTGNLLATDRIEIKKHGSVVGDLATARIMIEEGAYYKGSIEIARKSAPKLNLDTLLARPEKKSV